jgi:hypothetical protein
MVVLGELLLLEQVVGAEVAQPQPMEQANLGVPMELPLVGVVGAVVVEVVLVEPMVLLLWVATGVIIKQD